jgi:hypothetical protein
MPNQSSFADFEVSCSCSVVRSARAFEADFFSDGIRPRFERFPEPNQHRPRLKHIAFFRS